MSRKPVMTRRLRRHEEHTNHESWAIPYGDLVTLLLAFFVVMYAISSVNAGKYRVLSDSLFAAFRGTPRTMDPIQVGEKQTGSGSELESAAVQSALQGKQRSSLAPVPVEGGNPNTGSSPVASHLSQAQSAGAAGLSQVADEVARAMDDLVKQNLVVMRRTEYWIEVEIKTDILFPSGSAQLAPYAVDVIQRLGGALARFPNSIRVEGYTDNRPIKTAAFYSNWELSAARAGSVVRVLQGRGVNPERLAVIGYGEQRAVQSNNTEQGRNANRRVLVVILSTELQRRSGDQQDPLAPAATAPVAAPAGGAASQGAAAANVGAPPDATASPAATAIPVPTAAASAASATPRANPAAMRGTTAVPGEPAELPDAIAVPPNVTSSTPGARATGNGTVRAP